MEPFFLVLADVLESHRQQISSYGGRPGIHDLGLLQSAIAQPQAMFDGKFLHVNLCEMAAAYLFHIVRNHPFVDGNKRVAAETALLFLEINEFYVDLTDEVLVELVLNTIEGKVTKQEIADVFQQNEVKDKPELNT